MNRRALTNADDAAASALAGAAREAPTLDQLRRRLAVLPQEKALSIARQEPTGTNCAQQGTVPEFSQVRLGRLAGGPLGLDGQTGVDGVEEVRRHQRRTRRSASLGR